VIFVMKWRRQCLLYLHICDAYSIRSAISSH